MNNEKLDSKEAVDYLFDILEASIKNAHFWITERPALDQSRDALLTARGALLTLKEKLASQEFWKNVS